MSDAVEITKVVAPVVSAGFAAYIAFKMAQLNHAQNVAAVKTEEVAKTLKLNGERGDKKMDLILRVADGALGKQMKIAADALRVIALRTKDAGHIATADNAERDYLDHEASLAAAIAAGQPAPIQEVMVVNPEMATLVKLAEQGLGGKSEAEKPKGTD